VAESWDQTSAPSYISLAAGIKASLDYAQIPRKAPHGSLTSSNSGPWTFAQGSGIPLTNGNTEEDNGPRFLQIRIAQCKAAVICQYGASPDRHSCVYAGAVALMA